MIRNVHERTFDASIDRVGDIVDSLAGPNDQVWPSDAWPPMRLDRGLAVGSAGGHGSIRYHVESYSPGKSIVMRFEPGLGLSGTHSFTVEADLTRSGSTTVRHTIIGEASGPMRVVWPLAIRWLHDAVVEDALDNIGAALASEPAPVRKHSWVVRQLRSLVAPGPATSSVSIRSLGDVTALTLLAISALHAAWGLGLTWPGTDAVSLASRVVGGTTLPSSVDCFALAALLAAASGFVLARTRPNNRVGRLLPAPVSGFGVSVLGGVLALRATAGWLGSTTNLIRTTNDFRKLNLLVYSPLCAALAAGAFAVTGLGRGRSVERSVRPESRNGAHKRVDD
jgi:Protein of unknown function (DUF3995)